MFGKSVTVLLSAIAVAIIFQSARSKSRVETPIFDAPAMPVAAPAAPARPISVPVPVLTLGKYNKINRGMEKSEVDAILGFSGVEQCSDSSEGTYAWDQGRLHVIATFRDGRLVSKLQLGLQ